MSIPRFYCPFTLPAAGLFELPSEAAHHALRVLRLREGDRVQLFDGEGAARDALIQVAQGKHVTVQILGIPATAKSSPLQIVLVQAMSSSDKMDWIVQKAVELGAAEIHPVQTRYSVAKLTQERAVKRHEHWQGVVIAACEQCGRNALMPVLPLLELSHWLAQERNQAGSKFILHPENSVSLHEQPKPADRVVLLIGPEGGFAPDEMLMARQAGFQPILLGPRILRTETAALAGISALQTLWGEFF